MKPCGLVDREEGQTVIEYGLVVAFVSIVTLAVLITASNGWITSVTGQITAALS
jgi:Flp pilus assembly pilin Flp